MRNITQPAPALLCYKYRRREAIENEMTTERVISADSHTIEPESLWLEALGTSDPAASARVLRRVCGAAKPVQAAGDEKSAARAGRTAIRMLMR